ncbi:hypothetical protein F53441_8230 [Fusarium austroafricanum]|uniref:Uncharacterized protein n=1 Tax=Fusarium austroafricanum TaxID=2364996 RepID=A0A8H4KDS5_9HYPO|nr:hypothetical protein F53441_8230 [Fusarium austroafricanum]
MWFHPAVPPTEEEARDYYFGIPGAPRLVARSTTTRWVLPRDNLTIFYSTPSYPFRSGVNKTNDSIVGKMFEPIGKHPAVQLWNDSTGILRRSILDNVNRTQWNGIDLLRCGFERQRWTPDHKVLRPAILLISVEAWSTDWRTGRAIAVTCREILRAHGIYDVEVEIKESKLSQCSSTDEEQTREQTPFKLRPEMKESLEPTVQISEFLGAGIAPSHLPTCKGTKGLYLRPGNRTLESIPDQLDAKRREIEAKTEYYLALMERPNPPKDSYTQEEYISLMNEHPDIKEKLKVLLDEQMALNRFEERVRTVESIEARTIGHVLFSPKLGTSSSSPSHYRDWALIELDQDKHQTPLVELKNTVALQTMPLQTMPTDLNDPFFNEWKKQLREDDDWLRRRRFCSLRKNQYELDLAGVISQKEMRRPAFDFVYPQMVGGYDENHMTVLMYGSQSNLSIGVANNSRSVIRRIVDGKPVITEEWRILGSLRDPYGRRGFSTQGDSGACIMTMDGRAAAMLTRGAGANDESDHHISYATPIEWILEDIRGYGYDVEWLGEETLAEDQPFQDMVLEQLAGLNVG